MGSISPIHWILVALVVLLVFGPKTLSNMGRGIGRSLRSVQKLKSGVSLDVTKRPSAPRRSAAPPEKSSPSRPT